MRLNYDIKPSLSHSSLNKTRVDKTKTNLKMASREEIEEAFKLFDKNGDGTISASELGAAFEKLGQKHTDEEIKSMLASVDKDGNGSLNLEEFTKILNNGPTDENELKEAFKAFDKDGSGYITKDELKQAMKSMGEKLSDAEINEMIAAADTDKDGKVGFAEFKKMMSPS